MDPLSTPPPFAVLFEDHHLLVVNKPAPLLTQAPPGIPSLEVAVKEYIKVKYGKPAGVYLGVPHRLDRPVSGVICFCRNTKAAQRVHAQFQNQTVRKTYWAILSGQVSPESGTWNDWMKKVPDQARAVLATADEPGAKLASLNYRLLGSLDLGSFVELSPQTGRMHQLRGQAAWHGHPVLGDHAYGSKLPFGPPADLERDRVVALHARRLEFDHPFGKGRLIIDADPPPYWPTLTSIPV